MEHSDKYGRVDDGDDLDVENARLQSRIAQLEAALQRVRDAAKLLLDYYATNAVHTANLSNRDWQQYLVDQATIHAECLRNLATAIEEK